MKVNPTYGVARSAKIRVASVVVAMMIIAMLLAQLYGYEAFAPLLAQLLGIELKVATVAASALVLIELLALPYLLSMYQSRVMRYVSASASLFISGFWLFSALTSAHAANSGLFSDTLTVSGGLGAALWTLAVTVLVCTVLAADSKFRHATS